MEREPELQTELAADTVGMDKRLSELTDADFEVGRKAVEDLLVEFRERRISLLGRGNGLVIRESDGTESPVIRLGMEQALRIAVKAMLGEQSDGPVSV